jgi:hypothetical protein
LLPAIRTYNAKEGTEYDLFRLVFNILLKNGYQGVIFVYEYDSNIGVVLNFRDKEKPMYYYFEEGVLKMEHHGWSFSDLLFKEEQRENIKIDRFGIIFEGDLTRDYNLSVTDVEEWELREKWAK